ETLFRLTGYIPLTYTLFTWQNAVQILVMVITGVIIAYATAPVEDRAVTAEKLNIDLNDKVEQPTLRRPGDWLEHSPVLTICIGLLMAGWLALRISSGGFFATVSNLNNYIFLVLTLAFVLHMRPGSFMKAASNA